MIEEDKARITSADHRVIVFFRKTLHQFDIRGFILLHISFQNTILGTTTDYQKVCVLDILTFLQALNQKRNSLWFSKITTVNKDLFI